jgi:hypothetical protein
MESGRNLVARFCVLPHERSLLPEHVLEGKTSKNNDKPREPNQVRQQGKQLD